MTVPFFCIYDHLKDFIREGKIPDPYLSANACGYCKKILTSSDDSIEEESDEVRRMVEKILKMEDLRKKMGKNRFKKLQLKTWEQYLRDNNQMSASQAWHISETHGLDIEDISHILEDYDFSVDIEGFKIIKRAYSILNKKRSK